jgi:ABC-2 type transport system ATP-binding protein
LVGPSCSFLDEPTTGFDPEARRQFWELIRGLRTDGTTILPTTHYLDEAEALADRIAVIAARGRTNAETGPELFISEATVKTHLLRAFGKLGVSGRTAAVTVAMERGLLRPPGQ